MFCLIRAGFFRVGFGPRRNNIAACLMFDGAGWCSAAIFTQIDGGVVPCYVSNKGVPTPPPTVCTSSLATYKQGLHIKIMNYTTSLVVPYPCTTDRSTTDTF